jgi:hypothetical protein
MPVSVEECSEREKKSWDHLLSILGKGFSGRGCCDFPLTGKGMFPRVILSPLSGNLLKRGFQGILRAHEA